MASVINEMSEIARETGGCGLEEEEGRRGRRTREIWGRWRRREKRIGGEYREEGGRGDE